MRRFFFLAGLLVAGALCDAPPAQAEPMVTELSAVRARSKSVVIGTVTATGSSSVTINVDTSLVGGLPAGPAVLKAMGSRDYGLLGQRIVAFVDGTGSFEYYGKTVAGPDVEHGVLLLAGFYDFNAHLVVPGMVTLAQLKAYLATGTMPARTFVGTVGFPDGRGHVVPSAKHFVATVPPGHAATVTGFSLACLGPASFSGLDWGDVEVDFNDTCLKAGQSSRSLRLRGVATGADAMGNVTVLVSPASPIMNEPEYDTFAADGAITGVQRSVRFDGADGSRWTWGFDESLTEAGTVRKITTNHGTTITPPSAGSVYEDTWIYGDVTLALTQSGPAPRVSLGTSSAVLQAVDARVGTWTIQRKGAAPVRMTATQEKGVFVRR